MTLEELLAAMQAIIDQAKTPEGQPRALNDEEMNRYEELENSVKAIRRSDEIVERNRAYNTPAPGQPTGIGGRTPEDKVRDTEFREWQRFIRQTAHTAIVPEHQQRALGEGTGTAGGYLVPEGFRNKLVEVMKDFGGLAESAEVINTTTGNPLPWPSIDDTSNTGEIVQENGTFVGGADLAFTPNALNAYTYATCGDSAAPLYVSWELLQDAAFDVEGLISRKLGERIARTQAPHLITGTGVNQPMGILHGKTGVQAAANTGITYNDLLTYIHSVDPAYRRKAKWAFNDTTLKIIEQLADSNGDPLWRSMTSTMGDPASNGMLLNYPYVIDQGFPNLVVNSATVLWGVFGDIREGYVVRRVREVQLVVDPYSRASYRETAFSAYARMDATQQNTSAYSALTCKA